jgi:hypothetical protein
MGKPKEFEMPKGKILMGKNPIAKPVPGSGRKKPTPVRPGPKGMVNPGKKRALPMPKAKPGKPAPKGGTVIERKVQDNEQKKNGPISLGELRKRVPVDSIGQSMAKRKPVMPPRRGR